MEKTLKLLPTTINLDLWKEISKINEILNTKADITAVNELRDLIGMMKYLINSTTTVTIKILKRTSRYTK